MLHMDCEARKAEKSFRLQNISQGLLGGEWATRRGSEWALLHTVPDTEDAVNTFKHAFIPSGTETAQMGLPPQLGNLWQALHIPGLAFLICKMCWQKQAAGNVSCYYCYRGGGSLSKVKRDKWEKKTLQRLWTQAKRLGKYFRTLSSDLGHMT